MQLQEIVERYFVYTLLFSPLETFYKTIVQLQLDYGH